MWTWHKTGRQEHRKIKTHRDPDKTSKQDAETDYTPLQNHVLHFYDFFFLLPLIFILEEQHISFLKAETMETVKLHTCCQMVCRGTEGWMIYVSLHRKREYSVVWALKSRGLNSQQSLSSSSETWPACFWLHNIKHCICTDDRKNNNKVSDTEHFSTDSKCQKTLLISRQRERLLHL